MKNMNAVMLKQEDFMKKLKNVNINMLSMMIIGIILLAFAVFEYIENYLNNKSLEELGIYACSACNEHFIHVYTKIPAIISLIIMSMCVLLKITYKYDNSESLLIYRIISGIFYSFMVLSCFWYSFSVYTPLIATIIFDILVIAVSIILIRNTYSKRILK